MLEFANHYLTKQLRARQKKHIMDDEKILPTTTPNSHMSMVGPSLSIEQSRRLNSELPTTICIYAFVHVICYTEHHRVTTIQLVQTLALQIKNTLPTIRSLHVVCAFSPEAISISPQHTKSKISNKRESNKKTSLLVKILSQAS